MHIKYVVMIILVALALLLFSQEPSGGMVLSLFQGFAGGACLITAGVVWLNGIKVPR